MFRRLIPLPFTATALAIVAALALSSSGTVRATDTFPTKRPIQEAQPQTNAKFGSVVAIGDVNNDQMNEIVVGVPNATVGGVVGDGKIVVFFSNCLYKTVTLSSSSLEANAHLGQSLAVGDVTGPGGTPDGIPDIVAGAPLADVGSVLNAGKALVFRGTGILTDRSSAVSVLQDDYPEANAQFGFSLAVGNVGTTANSDTDTYNDVVVGGPYRDYSTNPPPTNYANVGHVWVF